jgi:TP901 family phage tail tape measure protein
VADYNLGTARGVIEIEYNGNGANQASRDLRATGSAADDAAARTSKAGGQLATAGAVIAGGLGLAVKSAADFEARLSAVQAVSGASAAEMEQLRDKSLQLGKDTAFSASESASAIEELVKAGLSVQDVMGGAADATVALAAAGEVSMPEAATIASNAMNQFNLSAEDMVNVADKIAGAANASAIDVGDFGMSLSQVGAVANLAGATFDDTAAAIALMGNAGIKGSDAGTSLKSMLMNLQPDTKKTADAMKELGIVTEDGGNAFYDAEGNLKSLSDISGVLAGSLEGMTKAQKQATLQTLFGADGIRAAAILADNGSKGFDKMADSMSKVTAAEVSATRLDNFQGSLEALQGSLETLMIQIGTPLLGLLRTVVDGFTGVLNVVLELPGPVLEAVTVFLALLSAGLLLVGGFLKLKAAFMAMRAGMLLFTGPIILVVAAIAALVAAFVYFYKNSERFRTIVNQIGAVLRDYLVRAIDYLVPKLQQFGAFLLQAFQASLPYLQRFGQFMQQLFVAAMPYVQRFIGFIQQLAAVFMSEVLPVIQGAATSALGALQGAFNQIWPAIQRIIPVVGDLVSSLVGLFQAIMGSPAIQFLISVLKILANLFVSTILPLLVRVGSVFFNTFVKVLGTAIRTALGVLRGVLNIIIGVIKVFTALLTGNWSKAWEGVKQILRGVVGVLGSILRGFLSTAGAIIKGIGGVIVAGVKAIPGLLRGLGSLFLAAGKFIIDQFVQGIKNAAGLISGIAGNIWDFVRGLLNGAIGSINSALEFTINPPGPGSVSINPPDIPQLAHGGVLTAPTMAWVAEAGEDEAVIPLRQLWRQLDRVYKAGKLSSLHEAPSRGRGASVGTATQAGRSRLVEGRLTIDRNGRAWIRGLAEDVVEGNDRFAGAHGRMG